MARWIGCRIPSEIQNLAWEHIDWERNAILIQSPKTACKGKPDRLVPIFPEIVDLLSKQFDEAEEGEIFVFPTLRNGIVDNCQEDRQARKTNRLEQFLEHAASQSGNRFDGLARNSKGLCLDW